MAKGQDQQKETRSKSKEESSKKTVASSKKRVSSKKLDLKPEPADPKPEDILKAKKTETKAAKKAGPKAERAKKELTSTDKSAKVAQPKQQPAKQARTRLERRGKNYRKAFEGLDSAKMYTLSEALNLLPKTSFVKFDPTVEMHIKLGVDPKQADQNIRATVVLPSGNGKTQRVAVLAASDKHDDAKAAGADLVGDADLLESIKAGEFKFDVLVSTPDKMASLGKYAKTLGPKGLMPNPKSGTVTNEIAKTVKELKSGRIEFRVDPSGIIHQSVGKLSYGADKLNANIKSFIDAVKSAKPASVKGIYIENAHITTSMGPSLRLDISNTGE